MSASQNKHDVAIVGLSCRFPGKGATLDGFWQSITAGESAWSKIPKERFNVDAFWLPTKKRNTSVTQGAHFLTQDISKFDAQFFSLPKQEVEAMDPQQRIMTEVSYEALESAGITLDKVSGSRTGVFMGHFTSDYKEMIYRDPDNAPSNSITGACKTSLANRISWLWDLRGPSFTVDTACSSSLVALHLACQSLQAGESDMAIVGGTSLLLNPEMFLYLSNQGFLSPDGRCKSFDESANGYGRGEGFGCVVLQRVGDAVSGGLPIRAVIRGTGSNQDGNTKGFTLPSADAQSTLIEETYRKAGLDFASTGYVEAHGTGTTAGDAAETLALSRTLCTTHTAKDKLIIGSVKSNIGHLEAAAGIAAVIKSVLILEHGVIPPSINFNKPNPTIKFDEWSLRVPTSLTTWPSSGVRRISVNSFGYGGTNAHAVLDDAYHYLADKGLSALHYTKAVPNSQINGADQVTASAGPRLVVLSAQDKQGLTRVTEQLTEHLDVNNAGLDAQTSWKRLDELAYTLSERRSALQWKSYRVASSLSDFTESLKDTADASIVAQSSTAPRLGFVFTGQGAQWARMGMELMAHPVFKASVMAADEYLRKDCECEWSAAEELQKNKSASQLHQAEYSQTLCTVLQVALVELLRTWNVAPTAVVGHSSGEIAAAFAMGALSREDAWKIAFYRGILSSGMNAQNPELDGSMMAAGLSPEDARGWISKVTEGKAVVACINSPTSVTISGDTPAIDELESWLKSAGIFARKLQVDVAYHSPHMELVAADYYDLLADVVPLTPSGDCTMHSSVTGGPIHAEQLSAVNWVRNLVSPVRFSEAVTDMLRPTRGGARATSNAVDLLIEIGPHSALQGPATQTLKAINIINLPYYSVLVRNRNAIETSLNLAGALFAHGVKVDIARVNGFDPNRSPRLLTDLPSYPWNHGQRYWHESRAEKAYLSRQRPRLSLLGAPSPSMGDKERMWKGKIRPSEEPWIADHRIGGAIVYPAAGYIAMAVEAMSQITEDLASVAAYRLRDVRLTSAAMLTDEAALEYVVRLKPHRAGTRDSSSTWTEFTVTSSPDGGSLVENCSGLIMLEQRAAEGSEKSNEKVLKHSAFRGQYTRTANACKKSVASSDFYSDLTSMGLEYGPAFANMVDIRHADGQSVSRVKIPDVPFFIPEGADRPHVVHPGSLDALFHLAFAAINGGSRKLSAAMVPKLIEEIVISADIPWEAGIELPGFSSAVRHGMKELNSDMVAMDPSGNFAVVEVSGFLCTEVAGAAVASDAELQTKSVTSKTTWRAVLELLSPKELEQLICRDNGLTMVSEYVKLLHHENPALAILETASTSQMSAPDSLFFQSKYIGGVLQTADATLLCLDDAAHSRALEDENLAERHVIVKQAAIDQAAFASQFQEQKFDVVIAGNLCQEGLDLSQSIDNALSILKSEGKLCILADHREASQLQSLFEKTGVTTQIFSGNEAAHDGQPVLLVATKKAAPHMSDGTGAHESREITLIQPSTQSELSKQITSQLRAVIESEGCYTVAEHSWDEDISSLTGKSCISLLELETSLLETLSECDFARLKSLVLGAANLLWVTGFEDPSAKMIDGLCRVVRNEVPGLSLRTLHTSDASAPEAAQRIGRVFLSTSGHQEFELVDGLVCASRIEPDEDSNAELDALLPNAAKTTSLMAMKDIPYPVKLAVQSPGALDSLCMELDDVPESELEADHVEIRVMATALNFREVMAAMGQISDAKLGLDAAGIIHRVGSAVREFKVGDRVAMYGHGSHRTRHRARADYCAHIPDEMTFEEAASIPTVHGTAWNALVRIAQVEKGQSVLVHAAAGGVGQAALQIAKHFELEVFATVSSPAKRQLIRDVYGVPDDHIFDSRDVSFAEGVKRMTGGRGVDVVLNSLAGEALRRSWYCVAPFGHFIEIGLRDILANTELDMRPFVRDTTFTFFNLTHLESERPRTMKAIIAGAFDFIRRGITWPVKPLVTYPISQVESAFRLMQTGKHMGKITLTWGPDDIVPVLGKDARAARLDPAAVYLLVGGLGGLGRSLATKLVELGARQLCFLSRSGADQPRAQELLRELKARGVQVQAHRCDVTDEHDVASAVAACTRDMGRIGGVFQCAMVLRDVLFANMSYGDWVATTAPKVQGSRNLHRHLPDVDFFVLLSSFAAVFGNRGQANYAAGGAYEDALAHHRRAGGARAIALDLGIMRDIGVLAETGITSALQEWEAPYGIRESEFHGLIELAITRDISGGGAPQVLTGFATGGSAVEACIAPPFYLDNPEFAIMARTGLRAVSPKAGAASGTGPSSLALIGQSRSLEEAAGHVRDVLVQKIAHMLQTPATEIDPARFLHSYGIDSLVAIELVAWLLKDLKTPTTVFDLLAGVPISTLAGKIAAKSALLPKDLVV